MLDNKKAASAVLPTLSMEDTSSSADDSTNQEYMKFYKEANASQSSPTSPTSPQGEKGSTAMNDDYKQHSEYCACKASGIGCECTHNCTCGSQ